MVVPRETKGGLMYLKDIRHGLLLDSNISFIKTFPVERQSTSIIW